MARYSLRTIRNKAYEAGYKVSKGFQHYLYNGAVVRDCNAGVWQFNISKNPHRPYIACFFMSNIFIYFILQLGFWEFSPKPAIL